MSTVADRRLWLTSDREQVVEDGDPRAAFLYATPGDEMTDEDVKRYGLAPKPSKRARTPLDKEAASGSDKRADAGPDKGA